MPFAFVPDDGRPHRLFRWTTLQGNLLATYDYDQNLLVIDKDKFDNLNKYEQSRVLRTHEEKLYTKTIFFAA